LQSVARVLKTAETQALLVPTGGPPSYASLIASADSIFVTADSVAMVSEAVLSRKPVGLVPIRPTAIGRAYISLLDRFGRGQRMRPRDLRFFWSELAWHELVGTLDEPRAGGVVDPGPIVARRVLDLLRR
jgi:hypothetical protein